ncbi:hypothetical protein [Streptomyces sp. NPDC020965]|uniref:hypothetical protein n=1 Tax=Streptomyces sp. NPDC020965 TaxID=3365105 RepID=UPI00379EAAC3
MTHNQPGPYGGPPQPPVQGYGPGPYGQPQQPVGDGYGYPTQPGAYGGPPVYPGSPLPPPPPKKRRTALIVSVSVVTGLAVIGAGLAWLGGTVDDGDGKSGDSGGENSLVADDTKGYRLAAPATVGEYKKQRDAEDKLSSADLREVEALGIGNPTEVGAEYLSGAKTDQANQKSLTFIGLWGEVSDPARTLDRYFAVMKSSGKGEGMEMLGSPVAVQPAGFRGALMKCQMVRAATGEKGDGPKSVRMPMCVWVDHSMLGQVTGAHVALASAGEPTPERDIAAAAAQLYKTGRAKV